MKKLELKLIKTKTGVTAANEDKGIIDHFEDDDHGRKEFVKFMLEEFINKEIEDGRKYQ